MNDWKSRYDYPGMSNLEKLSGRKLHTQNNCWSIAKVLFIVFAIVVAYTILSSDIHLSDFINFYNYLR